MIPGFARQCIAEHYLNATDLATSALATVSLANATGTASLLTNTDNPPVITGGAQAVSSGSADISLPTSLAVSTSSSAVATTTTTTPTSMSPAVSASASGSPQGVPVATISSSKAVIMGQSTTLWLSPLFIVFAVAVLV